MEENNILNKNNKKKILVGSIIIVMVLLLVVVGSTYAYFSLQVNGEGTSTKVTITTGSSKQIKLSGGLEDFHIKLDVKDMAYNRIDSEYYATSDSILPYVTNKEDGLTEIGKVEVIGDLEERHVCTASAKVTLGGSMATLIKKGDLELYLESEQYLNKSDLTEISNNYPATLEFVLENTKPIEDKSIKAYLKFTNRNDDQSYLAGQTLNVSIIIEDFKCTTDTVAPVIDKIYFNEDIEGQHYTNKIGNILYMSWIDEDVKEYCITQEEDTTNCIWKETNGQKNISEQIQLEDVEKDHLYNGYLKDNAGNISIKGTASIIYDKTLPTINKFYIKEEGSSKYTNQIKNKVYFQYNDTNIKDMCITEEETSTNCQWTTISESMDYTFANNNEGTKTIYGYVRDKASNISNIEKTDTITYDITPPTITSVEAPNPQETSLTLSITANETTSGIYQYCYSQKNSTNEGDYTCGASASITINSLQAGTSYDFYIYAKDNAGNGSPTNRQKYSFTTKAKPLKNVLSDADKNNTLQDTAVDGMYRFKGTASQVTNNYICLGPTAEDTCQDGNDMYRIIGITTDGKLKVIKAKKYGDNRQWNSGDYLDVKWNASTLYTYLNSTFYNSLNARIQGLIENHTWNMDLVGSSPWTQTTTGNQDGTIQAHIGLMSGADYVNAYQNSSKDNWLFITNGWSGNIGPDEWTMSRYGYFYNDESYLAWYVARGGHVGVSRVTEANAVRPVFYLVPNITLAGTGIITDPFRIQ